MPNDTSTVHPQQPNTNGNANHHQNNIDDQRKLSTLSRNGDVPNLNGSGGDFKMVNMSDVTNNGKEQNNKPRPRVSMQSNANSITKSLTDTKFLSRTKKFLKGICLTVLSGLFFSLTTLVVKYVKGVSPGTTAGFRYFGIILLAFPLAWESSQPMFGLPGTFIWIALRGLAGGTSVFCRYSALQYMSMADSTIIILSMPVFVFVFARIFLKEHFGRFHVLALFMSIIGIVFASKLDIIFGSQDDATATTPIAHDLTNLTTTTEASIITNATTMSSTYLEQSANTTNTTNAFNTINPMEISNHHNYFKLSNQLLGTMYSLGATFVGCFVYIIIRKLKSVDKYVILFNFSIISLIEMIIIDYFFFDFHLPEQGITPYLIFLVGILSFYAQLLLTRAIQIEEAGVVSVVRTSSEAFFAFILQIIFFGQVPDAFTITGAILVLSSVFLLSFRKYIVGLPDSDPTKKRFNFLTK